VLNNGPLGRLYRSYVLDHSHRGWDDSVGTAGSTDCAPPQFRRR